MVGLGVLLIGMALSLLEEVEEDLSDTIVRYGVLWVGGIVPMSSFDGYFESLVEGIFVSIGFEVGGLDPSLASTSSVGTFVEIDPSFNGSEMVVVGWPLFPMTVGA